MDTLDKKSKYDIFLNLDLVSLGRFCTTSLEINSICQDDNFWRLKLNQDFGDIELEPDMSWKELYMFHNDLNYYFPKRSRRMRKRYIYWGDDKYAAPSMVYEYKLNVEDGTFNMEEWTVKWLNNNYDTIINIMKKYGNLSRRQNQGYHMYDKTILHYEFQVMKYTPYSIGDMIKALNEIIEVIHPDDYVSM